MEGKYEKKKQREKTVAAMLGACALSGCNIARL